MVLLLTNGLVLLFSHFQMPPTCINTQEITSLLDMVMADAGLIARLPAHFKVSWTNFEI